MELSLQAGQSPVGMPMCAGVDAGEGAMENGGSAFFRAHIDAGPPMPILDTLNYGMIHF
jgi:hypothetical protein